MDACRECGSELPPKARFCPSCGVPVGIRRETFEIESEALIEKVKEILRDASVKRVIVKNPKGETLLTIPVTWGAVGALATVALAPWLAALGVITALAARVTVEVQRTE